MPCSWPSQDPYGDGLLQYSTESFADSGGEVIDQFSYDPSASSFESEVDRVVSQDPEALVIIGFEETSQILTTLFENNFSPADGKRIYLVDGNVGNALGEQLPAGSMEGIKGTLPQAELTEDFRTRLLDVDPELIDFSYGPRRMTQSSSRRWRPRSPAPTIQHRLPPTSTASPVTVRSARRSPTARHSSTPGRTSTTTVRPAR